MVDPAQFDTLTPEMIAALNAQVNAALRLNKYIRGIPTPPQIAFMIAPHLEAFFGGQAGPGKSWAILASALQFVDVPMYAAIIFRRTYQDLSLPGALMDRAHEWLGQTDAKWNDETKTWTFPSGATLTFGYLDHARDKYRYQGSEFQYIAFDELTQIREEDYRYLFSRLRKNNENPVPLRVRAASNPPTEDYPEGEWVTEYFVDKGNANGRLFIPATLDSNPHVDKAAYLSALNRLDEVTRAQLKDGNWHVKRKGTLFMPERLRTVPHMPTVGVIGRVRYWDKAGTEGGGAYTAGVRISRVDKRLYVAEYVIEHIAHGQWSAGRRNMIMRAYAGLLREGEQAILDALVQRGELSGPIVPDPPDTVYWVEQEPGSGGKESAEISVSEFAGREVHTERATGEKASRARPMAAQMEGYNMGFVDDGTWDVAGYLAELRSAPLGVYKDRWDGSAGGFNKLALLLSVAPPVATEGRDLTRGLRTGIVGGLR